MLRSNRTWWIAGALIAALIFVLLAAIAGRQAPSSQGSELAPGESETLRALVLEVLEEGTVDQGEFEQPYQRLRLRITEGNLKGQEVEVEHGLLGLTNQSRLFHAGDRLLVEHTRTLDGTDIFFITDYIRTGPLLWLTILFIAAVMLLSGWQGIRSLAGMGISLVIIVGFIVPQILAGRDPITIAILGSVVMMGISLYLVYGWNHKTHVAVAGLLFSLILTGLLAIWFVTWTRLSGFGAEEASFLQVAGVQLDPQGLLLAGIIIGTLGALDDVAVGQSSAIFELSKANPGLGWQALFKHGMNIGRDHLTAMVNTLLLAYVGAALPFLLLFTVYAEPLGMTLNREIIAEEIVRTLVGSLGLLAGVPLTNLLAAGVAQRQARQRDTVSKARVKAVCHSDRRTEPKVDVGLGELRAGWGLVGDSHAGPPQPGRWQISLLAWESVRRANQEQGLSAVPGSFAENLSTVGLDTTHLQVGDRLQIGEQVVLEVEHLGKPLEIAHTYSFQGHSLLPTEGVFCGVVVGGMVKAGDEITVTPGIRSPDTA